MQFCSFWNILHARKKRNAKFRWHYISVWSIIQYSVACLQTLYLLDSYKVHNMFYPFPNTVYFFPTGNRIKISVISTFSFILIVKTMYRLLRLLSTFILLFILIVTIGLNIFIYCHYSLNDPRTPYVTLLSRVDKELRYLVTTVIQVNAFCLLVCF